MSRLWSGSDREDEAIPTMPDYADRMIKAREAIDKAREQGIPVIFIQEVHRPDLVDFGRELDGSEDIHCLESDPGADIAVEEMGSLPADYLIKKRRYSAFFGTDFEILLRGSAYGSVSQDQWKDGLSHYKMNTGVTVVSNDVSNVLRRFR